MRMLGMAVVDPAVQALHEIHDLRGRFLEAEGRERPTGYASSPITTMRRAAEADDYEAFLAARQEYKEAGRTYDNFKRSLGMLDPLANRLNAQLERKFEQEYLTGVQQQRLQLAREHAAELEVKLWTWWHEAAGESEDLAAAVQGDIGRQGDALVRPRPLRRDGWDAWEQGREQAARWLERVDPLEARRAYWRHLQGALKDPELRSERFRRFVAVHGAERSSPTR